MYGSFSEPLYKFMRKGWFFSDRLRKTFEFILLTITPKNGAWGRGGFEL
ncbi:hypothetical protein [Okeania sp.]|nr:hypothetical protein [Okeania sp.]MEB3340365.1 hypothetical protein [Okeania sp.]